MTTLSDAGNFYFKKKKEERELYLNGRPTKASNNPLVSLVKEKSFFLRSSQSEMTGAVSYVGGKRKSPRKRML